MNQSTADVASRVMCGLRKQTRVRPTCPDCGERYMGTGQEPCVECDADSQTTRKE